MASTGNTLSRDHIARELKHFVGQTIELASAGLAYPDVIKHIGKLSAAHQKALRNGDAAAGQSPKSALFSEMTFYLDQDARRDQIVSMEFIANAGAFNMHDLRAAFGDWQRSPAEPEQASFAVAWFPRFDPDSGGRIFLYAEDSNYTSAIDADATPHRLFFQTARFRWGD